jgi:hypothetical protein
VRFEVLMVVKMLMMMFWVVTPYGLVGRSQCFGETWIQYVPPKHWYLPMSPNDITTQKINVVNISRTQSVNTGFIFVISIYGGSQSLL